MPRRKTWQERVPWRWRLLLALGVAALTLVAWQYHRHQQRQQAIAGIQNMGGYFGEGEPDFPQWAQGARAVFGDQLLAPFAKPSHYQRVSLWCKPATDADLERLAALTDVTQLDLGGTKVTDRGLAFLRGMSRLEMLELSGTQVTDAGLVHLRQLRELTSLRLDQCDITDAGIPHLQAIGNPELYVHLTETKVTSVTAGTLQVESNGDDGVLRVGQVLWIHGTCRIADPTYLLNEIDIDVLGNEEGSDEASHFGSGTCTPTRRRDGGIDFEILLPAPKRSGIFKVAATTFANLDGFRGFYTTGVSYITVQAALAGGSRSKLVAEDAGR